MNGIKSFFILILILGCVFESSSSSSSLMPVSLLKDQLSVDRAYVLNQLADRYLNIDLDTARMYADTALLLSSISGNYRQLSDAWVNLGNTYYFKGNLDSAKVNFQKSLDVIRLTTDLDEIASALNRLGLICEAKGDYDQAIEYYIKATSYFEQSLNIKGLADVYNNIGVVNDNYKSYSVAKKYYFKSLDLYNKISDKDGIGKTMNNIATLYDETNLKDSALFYISKARIIFNEMNHPTEEATCLLNIAIIYQKEDVLDSVFWYLDRAEEKFQITGNLCGLASVNFSKGKYYLALEEVNFAIVFLEKALDIRCRVGNLQDIFEVLRVLASAYEENGNYNLSLEIYKEAQQISDSIVSRDMHLRFQELQVQYETSKKDRDLLLYKKKMQERHVTITYLFFGGGALFIVSILFFYLFRIKARLLKSETANFSQQEKMNKLVMDKQKVENKLLEEEILKQREVHRLENENYHAKLEHKSRELLTSAMHIVNKNKILASIHNALEKISLDADPVFRKSARRLCRDIDSNINIDSDWDQFKKHFDAVNTDFFEKLQKSYPDLSQGDLRVCAYIKIKLSSKEIAHMMNISPAGINKRLYRIRRKMDLPTYSNISEYLDKI